MTNEKKEWSRTDLIKSGKTGEEKKPMSQEHLSKEMALKNAELEAQNVLARFQERRIDQKAALQLLKEHHAAKLEVARTQLQEAVRVKKREVVVDAERLLAEINQRHMQDLNELGLSNTQDRMLAQEKLLKQTSDILERLENGNFPETLKMDTIESVIKLHERFSDSIMNQGYE